MYTGDVTFIYYTKYVCMKKYGTCRRLKGEVMRMTLLKVRHYAHINMAAEKNLTDVKVSKITILRDVSY